MTQLLAHQGGWDELLWFAGPVVLVVLWVRWAERRARQRRRGGDTRIPADKADEGTG